MSTPSSPNDDVLSSDHHHHPPGPSGVLDVVIKNGFVIPVKLQFQHRQETQTELQSQTRLETQGAEEGDNNNDENDNELSPQVVEAAEQTIYLTPCTTVTDLKHLIHQRYGIEPKNQRLRLMVVGDQQQEDANGREEDGRDGGDGRRRDSRPIFYGQFLDSLQQQQQQQQSVTVAVEDVPVDPTWQAFYDMTGYDDWKERDQITQYMCRGRNPRHCPEGSPLVQGTTRFPCFKCGLDLSSKGWRSLVGGKMVAVVPMVSALSNEDDVGDDDPPPFVLCTRCYEEDTGTPEIVTDPYRFIFDLSLEMGRRLTGISCGYGGFGHDCGYPTASLNSSQIEFSNKKMRPKLIGPVVIPDGASPDEIAQIRREHKKDSMRRRHKRIGIQVKGRVDQVVAPAGVHRVVVKLKDDQRQAVINAGHGNKLSSVEIDVECNRQNPSLSSRDVIRFRESIKGSQNEELWDVIKMHIQSQSQLIEEPYFYPSLKCVTYEVDQVLFELSVKVVDMADY